MAVREGRESYIPKAGNPTALALYGPPCRCFVFLVLFSVGIMKSEQNTDFELHVTRARDQSQSGE